MAAKMKLAWDQWLYGLLFAVIGGGAGSVSAAIGVNIVDPKDWNVTDHPAHLLYLMGVCFCVNGFIAFFGYLKQKPLPDVETVTTTQTVDVQPTSAGGVKATTTTQQETKSS